MSNIPSELRYTTSHEWVRLEEDGTLTMGITDHAQALLGDLVFVELPEVETEAKAEEEIGVVESVKAASDIYSPVNGEVVAVNDALKESPDLVNNDPYGNGWLVKLKPADTEETRDLLDADDYEDQLEADEA